MSKSARKILGEAADFPSPEATEQDLGTPAAPQAPLTPGESIPIESLLASWQKGDKSTVAVRVLDALDSYQQFVSLCFKIGQEGALELGGIMDELTAEEKSPHEYDVTPDTELMTKVTGKGPQPGPATHAAVSDSQGLVRHLIGT